MRLLIRGTDAFTDHRANGMSFMFVLASMLLHVRRGDVDAGVSDTVHTLGLVMWWRKPVF